MTDNPLAHTLGDNVKSAKARFKSIDETRLAQFISDQDNVTGEVRLGEVNYLSDGAGSSNGIALFTAHVTLDGRPRDLDLVARYDPGVRLFKQGRFCDEFNTLTALERYGFAVPGVYWIDIDGEQLGCPGYIMDRAYGEPPRQAFYSTGALADVSPEARKEMMLQGADFLARLHSAEIGAETVPHLVTRGEGGSGLERELRWWLNEVHLAAPADNAMRLYLDAAHDWLLANRPADLAEVLVHGDANFGNIMFMDGRISAVLDWELSYLGLGETDLAYMTVLSEMFKVLDTPAEGVPTEAEFIARYEQGIGRPVRAWAYSAAFAYFKIACVGVLAATFMPPEVVAGVAAMHRQGLGEKLRAAGAEL